MNNDNFNKLFTDDYSKAKVASLVDSDKFKSASKQEKRKIVERKQIQISPELGQAINNFIKANKGRVHGNQLRAMVKKRFGITVV